MPARENCGARQMAFRSSESRRTESYRPEQGELSLPIGVELAMLELQIPNLQVGLFLNF